jgi:AraC-like DNA-binding protein
MPKVQAQITPIDFENARLNSLGVEVISLKKIRKLAANTLLYPQRLGFHLLLLMTEGEGEHTVDFKHYPLQPGTLIYVRPGQVQQWHMQPRLQGELILLKPEALSPAIGRSELDMRLLGAHLWAASLHTNDALREQIHSDMTRLREDIASFNGSEMQAAIIWHTLLASLLRVAQAMYVERAPADYASATLFAQFEQLLAKDGQRRKPVSDFTKRLGYSESTLNRACLAQSEKTTKRLIDERTALEAKRLLVHSPASISEISYRLGFSEATNFVKFFVRLTQTTPKNFREQHVSGV